MLADKRVLALAAVFFLTGMPSYGLSLWMPQIVKGFGVSPFGIGLLTAVPFLFGCIAMILWGHRSDAHGERLWHASSSAVVGGIGLVAGAMLTSATLQLVAVCVAAAGIYGLKGPFLTMVSAVVRRDSGRGRHRARQLARQPQRLLRALLRRRRDSDGGELSARAARAGCAVRLGAVVLVFWYRRREASSVIPA